MNRERIAQLLAQAVVCWEKTRARAARLPAKAWMVLGVFLFVAMLMALHTALAGKDATLRLKVQHSFRSAQISVWVDGDLVYSGKLAGFMHKKFGLIPDSVGGSLSQTISVPSGEHEVRVRVESDDGSIGEDRIGGEFAGHGERALSVVARRSGVSLDWQGSLSTAADSSSGSGWLGRYTGSLLMTIAGSIISALTGYAIKEIPKQIASRQSEAPKA